MTYEELRKLHSDALTNVTAAHQAYQTILGAYRNDNSIDTDPAFQALLAANRVKSRIYGLMLAAIAAGN